MPLVLGDGYCDGFLALEIFPKKRLKVLETRGFVKIIDVEKNTPLAQTQSLAEKLNHLRVSNDFSEAQNLLDVGWVT